MVASFVAEKKLGIGPAFVLIADQVLHRHPHVIEPDLVYFVLAPSLHRFPGGRIARPISRQLEFADLFAVHFVRTIGVCYAHGHKPKRAGNHR